MTARWRLQHLAEITVGTAARLRRSREDAQVAAVWRQMRSRRQ
jgi:hypothetical protein